MTYPSKHWGIALLLTTVLTFVLACTIVGPAGNVCMAAVSNSE